MTAIPLLRPSQKRSAAFGWRRWWSSVHVSTSTWSVVTNTSVALRIALARVLLRSEESTAANQIEVSTNRLIGRRCLSPDSAAQRFEGLCNHRILVGSDVGTSGTSEVEYSADIGPGLRSRKIARHKLTHVFSHRHTDFARSLPGAPLQLAFERNLSAYHHDGSIIPSNESNCRTVQSLTGAFDSANLPNSSMSEPRSAFVHRLWRQTRQPLLTAPSEQQHRQPKDQQHQPPPKIGVDPQAGRIDSAAPGGQTESRQDHADQREHHSHGDAQIETHALLLSCTTCSRKSSNSKSVKENVQSNRHQQHRNSQRLRALPPHIMRPRRLGSERVHQPHQFRLRSGLGCQAHDNSHNEVGTEGEDRAPEVLRHVARIVVDHCQPSAVNAGVGFDGQREI